MKILNQFGWVYYLNEDTFNTLTDDKCGKWMYFFSNKEYASEVCSKAIENNIVVQSKHSDANEGVACFYLEIDDIDTHKAIISFFIENNLIRKTKTGKLYNISFKLDNQTRTQEYGADFVSELKLEKFVNLQTGEWIYKEEIISE